MTAARELWWKSQEFSSVDIIPPWFFTFIYHLGDEQYAGWWPQFSDVILSFRHDFHQAAKLCLLASPYLSVGLTPVKTRDQQN
jgi:hypothetical protein